jgi:hypothetical protein
VAQGSAEGRESVNVGDIRMWTTPTRELGYEDVETAALGRGGATSAGAAR